MELLTTEILKKTALETGIPLWIVEEVVNFQFKDAWEHAKTNTSVEIAGFGTFKVSPQKLRQRIEMVKEKILTCEVELRKETLSEKRREAVIDSLGSLERQLQYIEDKLKQYEDRLQRDPGGGMEFSLCAGECREGS